MHLPEHARLLALRPYTVEHNEPKHEEQKRLRGDQCRVYEAGSPHLTCTATSTAQTPVHHVNSSASDK